MHPYHEHRQTKKEHSRVGKITKGYASGGAVNRTEDDRKVRKMSASQEREVNPEGGVSPHRMDRPKRAKGGKVKRADGGQTGRQMDEDARRTREILEQRGLVTPSRAKGGRVGKSKGSSRTIVNVITGGHPAGGAVPPMPAAPPPPAGIAGAAMPPPMAAKPPMPMPPPGGPPPGMPMRARGGGVKSKGMHVGTKVSHDNGKSDLADMNRKRVVTFKTGGGVKTFMAGGRVESPDGVAKATKLPGGGGGGEARLAKAHRAERR